MRVLIDVHHSDLMESLHRLFGDRLGMDVVVPYGMEWKREGVWDFGRVYPDGGEGVAKQFLLMDVVDELQPNRTRHMVTLEEARDLDFDVVVASVPENYFGYHRFADEKGARFAIQVGNVNQYVDHTLDPLVLDATGQYPGGVPFTPEFDLDGVFAHSPLNGHPLDVASFANLFPNLPCYPLFTATMAVLPAWEAFVGGHNATFIKPVSVIADLMALSSFGWHDKVTGDGFGYVVHYWAAIGRPLIGHASHYRGQTAGDLWEDGVTCIDLDLHSPVEAAQLMEAIVADADRHDEMCQTIAERVRARIDFAADADRVANALGVMVTA